MRIFQLFIIYDMFFQLHLNDYLIETKRDFCVCFRIYMLPFMYQKLF